MQELTAELGRLWKRAIVVPNSWLPEEYHNNKEWVLCENEETDYKLYGPSLEEIEQKYEEINGERIRNQEIETQKEIRGKAYTQQYEKTGEIEYIEDDYRLYRNQLTFCKLLGLISEEDLE
jgi:hypothetical protein